MTQVISATVADTAVTSENIRSVYSKLRTAQAPVFTGIEGLAINQRQQNEWFRPVGSGGGCNLATGFL